jgi:hypothetical protein
MTERELYCSKKGYVTPWTILDKVTNDMKPYQTEIKCGYSVNQSKDNVASNKEGFRNVTYVLNGDNVTKTITNSKKLYDIPFLGGFVDKHAYHLIGTWISIQKGIEQAEAGEVHDLDDFTPHLNQE